MEYLQQNNPTNVFFMFLMMDLLPDSGKILNQMDLSMTQLTMYFILFYSSITYKQNWRRWMIFFHDDCGVIPNEKKNGITLSVFIGFENIESQNIIYMAGEKMFTVIEPDEYHYKVRKSNTF